MRVPDLRSLQSALILRLSSIGDVVHALPVASALKRAHPHLRLTWIVEEMSAPLVMHSPCLEEVLVIPRQRWKRGRLRSPGVWAEYLHFLRDVRSRRFDLCLDLQGYAKSGLLALASGAPYRYGWHRLRDVARLVSHPVPPRAQPAHRVEQFLDVVRMLGVDAEPVEFPLGIPAEARARAQALLRQAQLAEGAPFAVVNPAAGSPTKRWPTERFAEVIAALARRAGMRSVLVGIARDAHVTQAVSALAARMLPQDSLCPADLTGQTDLLALAALLERCAVHICGDTGSAHIAAALHVPVVSIYGPTRPELHGPWGQLNYAVRPDTPCPSGCSERRCVRLAATQSLDDPSAYCLREISSDRVIEAALAACEERARV